MEATEKLSQILASPDDEVYVAESKEGVVGWLHLFLARRLASTDFYEIGGLVVSPDCRGKGVGRHLVKHVSVIHKGKVRVRCNETREESHRFYEAIGFRNIKAQRIFETSS